MHDDTWRMIAGRFQQRPETKACPVDAEEFDRIMQQFGTRIDRDYREFVLRYGGGFVGPNPVFGLRKAEMMGTVGGKGTAPEITQWFKNRHWPGVEDWLIFSIDQGGNPVGFAPDGTVWLSDQLDFGQMVQLATGFEDYILKWCLKVRKVS